MGRGTDIARLAGAGIHADVIDDLKDQLLIVFIKRLADEHGRLSLSVAEIDDTGLNTLAFSVSDGCFHFTVGKKS